MLQYKNYFNPPPPLPRYTLLSFLTENQFSLSGHQAGRHQQLQEQHHTMQSVFSPSEISPVTTPHHRGKLLENISAKVSLSWFFAWASLAVVVIVWNDKPFVWPTRAMSYSSDLTCSLNTKKLYNHVIKRAILLSVEEAKNTFLQKLNGRFLWSLSEWPHLKVECLLASFLPSLHLWIWNWKW